MVYLPDNEPKKAIIYTTAIVIIAALGGYLINKYIIAIVLAAWMYYMLVLSYYECKIKEQKCKNITELFLQPQAKFFFFEFVVTVGILAFFRFNWIQIGIAASFILWATVLSVYMYRKGKYKK
ncbi:hypothetical protein GOV06_02125 [Candidatus Woesearchaeota archaeon]|nr:hypothetical protein [Candidatus Woesearchaeota archaeon]